MSINREQAVAQLSQIKVKGNSEGLIPAFGVLIQFLPTNFWNTFTEKMIKASEISDREEIKTGLERAAAECGYHTGWGIINSEEFKSIVGPMIEKEPDDILHGAFAVLTAWGWADSRITSLDPGSRMVIQADGYYESEIADTYTTKEPVAFMLKGICRAFMDIAYGKPYPDGLGTFTCVQTKGIEIGDPYGEFVVTKADSPG
jgi:CRISPR/Cas system CSM-associated protein Csm2 small subunit